jgi:hypothetical protein
MRCLAPKEAEDLFGPSGFRVSSEHEWYRIALVLDRDIATRQIRIGGRPTPNVSRLAYFAEALNRWLPTSRARLLWVDHWNSSFPSPYEFFVAARVGLGEMRSLSEAPGHYFDPYPYDERDQLKIPPKQARQTGILIGLMAVIMVGGWDGWLVAEGSSDQIEFWEGNVFFHSNDSSRLADAKTLMMEFDCPRDLV